MVTTIPKSRKIRNQRDIDEVYGLFFGISAKEAEAIQPLPQPAPPAKRPPQTPIAHYPAAPPVKASPHASTPAPEQTPPPMTPAAAEPTTVSPGLPPTIVIQIPASHVPASAERFPTPGLLPMPPLGTQPENITPFPRQEILPPLPETTLKFPWDLAFENQKTIRIRTFPQAKTFPEIPHTPSSPSRSLERQTIRRLRWGSHPRRHCRHMAGRQRFKIGKTNDSKF